ncbi:hypothetical protein L917_19097 [Phytophthora nicotianae]|uniref:Uncharacterized protein n=1 Tax=Phytophthora nicotianae TaxID=4792 RepID=W2K5G9_PHYNI|nr:hypothetical protein L917_19097 [Phytophthora nicotianae]
MALKCNCGLDDQAVDDARVTGDDAVWQVLTGNPVQARDGDELVVCADGESSAHRLELL